jgi:hypothetical protein
MWFLIPYARAIEAFSSLEANGIVPVGITGGRRSSPTAVFTDCGFAARDETDARPRRDAAGLMSHAQRNNAVGSREEVVTCRSA